MDGFFVYQHVNCCGDVSFRLSHFFAILSHVILYSLFNICRLLIDVASATTVDRFLELFGSIVLYFFFYLMCLFFSMCYYID